MKNVNSDNPGTHMTDWVHCEMDVGHLMWGYSGLTECFPSLTP